SPINDLAYWDRLLGETLPLAPWVRMPFSPLQLLVFLAQEPFVHARAERRFEHGNGQLAFALLDGPIRQYDDAFPRPRTHFLRQLFEQLEPILLGCDLSEQRQRFFILVVQI